MGEDRKLRREASVDELQFRFVMSHFATGVAVITGRNAQRQPRAITVNAFTSVSLNPPLVLYCLDRSAFHFDVFANAKAFAINILNEEQQDLSDRFAREAEDGFPNLSVTKMVTGSPILTGCLAVLDCETEALYEAGDHLIIIGYVRALDVPRQAEPLIYFRSRYRHLKP